MFSSVQLVQRFWFVVSPAYRKQFPTKEQENSFAHSYGCNAGEEAAAIITLNG
jgi:hypothetical protein